MPWHIEDRWEKAVNGQRVRTGLFGRSPRAKSRAQDIVSNNADRRPERACAAAEQYVRRLVAAAPPLTAEQLDKLAVILHAPVDLYAVGTSTEEGWADCV